MFILSALIISIVVCYLLAIFLDSDIGDICLVFVVIFGAILLGFLLALPLNHMEVNAKIKEFESVNNSISETRKAGIDLQDATITIKIIECNREIANLQFWNDTTFGLWIPDATEDLEYLK
uniref:Uncharacterized protein n=1 Tax=viral metagenome TaxID=1070528 RepID=A0A6M3L6H0_9ZZZZ